MPPTISPAAFADFDPAAPLFSLGGETMGTCWTAQCVQVRGVDPAAIHARIVARLDGLVAEMSHWERVSHLSRFNRAAAGSWTSLAPDFAHVIASGLRIADESGGAFDPAIGRLVNLWGFGPPGAMPAPDAGALAAARDASGWRRLDYDAHARRLRQPGGLALDLSGIAKGYAADALAALLREAGVRHCLVEVGGEFVGSGIRPDGDPWWVELEASPGAALPPLRIALHDLAVATSGDYRRGRHNLDPRTGCPAEAGVTSASVLHATAMEADAWASALTVLGAEEGMKIAARMGLAARIVTRRRDAWAELLSPALQAMLDD